MTRGEPAQFPREMTSERSRPMPLPRVRLRTLMIAVAVVAVCMVAGDEALKLAREAAARRQEATSFVPLEQVWRTQQRGYEAKADKALRDAATYRSIQVP